MSTPYLRGRGLEYRVRSEFVAAGYVAWRIAGSHSPMDVIAMRPGPCLVFVQCQRDVRLPPRKWNALYDLALMVGAIPVFARQVGQRGGIAYLQLQGRRQYRGDPVWDAWHP